MPSTSEGPLGGVRVVDISAGIAAAYAARLMLDAGACLVKAEGPGGSELRARTTSGLAPAGEDTAFFHYLYGGARSVVAAIVTDDLGELLADADVVLWSPGSALSDQVAPVRMCELAPRAVVTALTPHGLDGPWAERPGNHFTSQAWSGTTAFRGTPDRPPVVVGAQLGDWYQGVCAAAGALGALRRARRDGTGEIVDVSGLETASFMSTMAPVTYFEMFGRPSRGERTVNLPDIYPTSDGFVGFMVVTGQQWLDFCVLIGRDDWLADESLIRLATRRERAAELASGIDEKLRTMTTAQVMELADALRVPAAPIVDGRTALEVGHFRKARFIVENPHGFKQPSSAIRFLDGGPAAVPAPAPALGEARAFTWPPRQAAKSQDAQGRDVSQDARPLHGIRVADFTAFWAGPVTGQWLAALGADVIHVESVQRPDGIRSNTTKGLDDPEWPEWSPYFHGTNNDKRDVTIDMSAPEGRRLAEELIAVSDILVENYSPRVMEDWGLTWERVRGINPRLIMLRLPAYGVSGPWRDRGGYAQTIEMAAGLAACTGYPDGPPSIPNGACDPIAGTHAAVGALLGLYQRDRTGVGALLEIPMIGSALAFASEQVIEYSAYGAPTLRHGNRSPLLAPQGLYSTADGTEERIAISVDSDRQWLALREVLGDPEWAVDAAFGTVAGRLAAHDLIDEYLAAWASGLRADKAVALLCKAGVPAARVLYPHQQDSIEQLRARGYFRRLAHPVAGEVTYNEVPALVVRDHRPTVTRPAPTLGQHNEQVLGGLLGHEAEELTDLEASGVIGQRARATLRTF